MGVGDSITEGGDYFICYLFPLWEKLFTAGYTFDFIGIASCLETSAVSSDIVSSPIAYRVAAKMSTAGLR